MYLHQSDTPGGIIRERIAPTFAAHDGQSIVDGPGVSRDGLAPLLDACSSRWSRIAVKTYHVCVSAGVLQSFAWPCNLDRARSSGVSIYAGSFLICDGTSQITGALQHRLRTG